MNTALEKGVCILCIEEAEEAKENKNAESAGTQQLWQPSQVKWLVMFLDFTAANQLKLAQCKNQFADVNENYICKCLQVKLDPGAQITVPASFLSSPLDHSFL